VRRVFAIYFSGSEFQGNTEHISRIWEMFHILERKGIYVKKIRTDKLGYVIYEDRRQLVVGNPVTRYLFTIRNVIAYSLQCVCCRRITARGDHAGKGESCGQSTTNAGEYVSCHRIAPPDCS
jgi:hypothetical protein